MYLFVQLFVYRSLYFVIHLFMSFISLLLFVYLHRVRECIPVRLSEGDNFSFFIFQLVICLSFSLSILVAYFACLFVCFKCMYVLIA